MALSASEAQEHLSTACQEGDVARVSQLFANQPLDGDDATSELEDLTDMDPALIRVLLSNGADVNVITERNIETILKSERANELMKLLDEYHCDFNSVVTTRAILRLSWSKAATESIKLLAECHYDFKSRCHCILQDFAHDKDALDCLLDQGVDINSTDIRRLDDGFCLSTAETDWSLHLLNIVAANGDIDLFDHLVRRGADPSRSTALHSAAKCKDQETSKAMICHLLDKHNMNIDSNNDDFRDFFHDAKDTGTPLCTAILKRNLPAFQELLKRGASLDYPNSRPSSYAAEIHASFPAFELLLRAGLDPTKALRQAVSCENLDAAKLCMEFGADPALQVQHALSRSEYRTRFRSELADFYQEQADEGIEEDPASLEEAEAIERDSKAILELLIGAMDSDALPHTAISH